MCNGENYSCAITIIISLLFGVLSGIVFFLGILTEVTIALGITVILAFLIAIFLFVLIIIPRYNLCVRNEMGCIIVALIGTLISSVIALSIDLAPGIISAFLIGIIVFFLSLLVIKFLKLIACIISLNNSCASNNVENCDCDTSCNSNNSSCRRFRNNF